MIFVTGGTGLVGSHLLFELTKAGNRVKALKRAESNLQQVLKTFSWYSDTPSDLFNLIDWVDGDILDYFSLEKLLAGVTEIYHCAAVISFDGSDRQKMIGSNVQGTANLVNAAIENGIKRICHVSSIAALGGSVDGQPVTEDNNWTPAKKATAYSESKFFSELEIWRGIEEGIDAVIVNPSIIIGPGNWNTGSSQMIKLAGNGLKFYIGGTTGYVDVNDVVKAMLLLMKPENFEKAKNQRFLLSAENLSYRDFFRQAAEAFQMKVPKIKATPLMLNIAWRGAKLLGLFTSRKPMLTREIVDIAKSVKSYDGSKISRTFDFKYQPVAASIKQTVEFYRKDNQTEK